ncbi:unnamed protein product [Candidula unifasciata]|uniref:Metalloendopeptidase n=1 Tax=Candidula unifasciata TaxID=100452 RepID=A0A8S3YP16_9EUPU|nr:unnamed protein product [Candidula unifasciata]
MDSYKMSRLLVSVWSAFVYFYLFVLSEPVMCKSIDKQILDAAPKAEMFDLLHLMPEGKVMIMAELDLLLTLQQYKNLYTTPNAYRQKRKAVRDTDTRWTNCRVYYEITQAINTTNNRAVIKEAIEEWEKYTCLEFIECAEKPQRIQFMDGGGCYSQLGMQTEPQVLVLAPGCRKKGIVVHEIGHAVGWYHEHMRPDRDDFVAINLNVVPDLYHPNFIKYNNSVVNTYDIPYDYTSVMHYGNEALPGSLTTLDPSYQTRIGQRQGLSFKDIKLANIMYNCSGLGCKLKTCSHNGFVLFKEHKGEKKCSCWCDSGNVDDPLVLCSSIDKEPAQPKPVPTQLPATKPCRDVRNDCNDLKLQDADVCMTKTKLMMASCAKTCDFCGKGENMCMDYEKGCPLLAASAACKDPALERVMSMLCPASCGVCKPTNPCNIQQELMGSPQGRNEAVKVISSRLFMHTFVLVGLSLTVR